MKRKSLDLSGKIDPFIVELFEVIADTSESLNIEFFIVGAAARDMILEKGYGIRANRATEDLDLGVYVSNWEIYNELKEKLISTQKFIPDRKMRQRILYQEEFPVDLIPFGKIADPDNSLLWPPENEIEMSTIGFKEAYNDSIAVIIRTKPILEIQFASLAGLTILKLIAWNDNYSRREKDAKDLYLLLTNYLDAGNMERLYDDEKDLLGKDDFDYELAGAQLLGRDIAEILSPDIKGAILKILDNEVGDNSKYMLVYEMLGPGADSSDFEKPLQLLTHLKKGVEERL